MPESSAIDYSREHPKSFEIWRMATPLKFCWPDCTEDDERARFNSLYRQWREWAGGWSDQDMECLRA